MLREVLQALEGARGPVSLDELSRQLGVERSALEGMIAYWVRKGRLRESGATCSGSAGGCSCSTSAAPCPFSSAAPRTITLLSR